MNRKEGRKGRREVWRVGREGWKEGVREGGRSHLRAELNLPAPVPCTEC